MIIAGVDIETTGVDITKHHRLIQIGIATEFGLKIVHDVHPRGKTVIDPAALEVNGFTHERILAGERQRKVDVDISELLKDCGYRPGDITPVGWNVGGFDLSFIKRELPLTSQYFSYRAIDLTGIAILHEMKTGKSYRDLKVEFAAEVVKRLGRDQRHDALYDAEAALVTLQLFKELDWNGPKAS